MWQNMLELLTSSVMKPIAHIWFNVKLFKIWRRQNYIHVVLWPCAKPGPGPEQDQEAENHVEMCMHMDKDLVENRKWDKSLFAKLFTARPRVRGRWASHLTSNARQPPAMLLARDTHLKWRSSVQTQNCGQAAPAACARPWRAEPGVRLEWRPYRSL